MVGVGVENENFFVAVTIHVTRAHTNCFSIFVLERLTEQHKTVSQVAATCACCTTKVRLHKPYLYVGNAVDDVHVGVGVLVVRIHSVWGAISGNDELIFAVLVRIGYRDAIISLMWVQSGCVKLDKARLQ